MKQTSSLARALTLPMMLLVILMITSCSKSVDELKTGNSKPSVTVVAKEATVWYGKTVQIYWTSDQVITVGNTTGTSGSFVAGPFTSSTKVNVTGYTSSGIAGTGSTDITVIIDQITKICWDDARNQNAKWKMISFTSNGQAGPLDCNLHTYSTTGQVTITVMCGTDPLPGTTYVATTKFMNGATQLDGGPDNVWGIEVTLTTLTLTQTKNGVTTVKVYGKVA